MERPALAPDRRHHHDLVARPQHLPQQFAALLERQVEQPATVEVEQVEHEVGDRAPGPPVEPLAEGVVIRAAAGVHHDQLAVEHRRPGHHPDGQSGELRQPVDQLVAGRVHDPNLAATRRLRRAYERQRAVAAPGGLEQEVGGVEGFGARRRPHGRHVARARERRLEPEGELLGHRGSMVAPRRG